MEVVLLTLVAAIMVANLQFLLLPAFLHSLSILPLMLLPSSVQSLLLGQCHTARPSDTWHHSNRRQIDHKCCLQIGAKIAHSAQSRNCPMYSVADSSTFCFRLKNLNHLAISMVVGQKYWLKSCTMASIVSNCSQWWDLLELWTLQNFPVL